MDVVLHLRTAGNT